MDKQNNSHLIAGFFRYHREKLNYSLRGLVGDGSVVDLSSLSAFERGKRMLSETQLGWLFAKIGFNFSDIIAYDNCFDIKYNEILNSIYLGDSNQAKQIFIECVTSGVFNTLACINFSLIQYVLYSTNVHDIQCDKSCFLFENLFDCNQICLLKIAYANEKLNDGLFDEAINLFRDTHSISVDTKLSAWILFQLGISYGLSGNYIEATVALLDAKKRYSEFLGFVRMIQVNLNLGSAYISTNSFLKAEESYLDAYQQAKLLCKSTSILSQCFNSLCWLYFETNQYDKVEELLNNKPKELVESRNTYFILAWTYYKLGKKEEAIKYCRDGLEKFSKYTYVCMIYEYIEKACKGIKTGQDALLRKIIETEDYDHDALTEKLFTYELIDIYERRKNYEKAFKYAKKLLNR